MGVPTIGFRKPLNSFISFDASLYTAIISPQFELAQKATSGGGCKAGGGKFEDTLPCEGNAELRPYIATLIGFTAGTGNSSLGIVTIGATAGVARTGQDPSGFAFYGLMVTTGGIFATLPIGKSAKETVAAGKKQ
ncbi:MAG: hypothetical protein U0270_22990 [Labilithrix sp.]